MVGCVGSVCLVCGALNVRRLEPEIWPKTSLSAQFCRLSSKKTFGIRKLLSLSCSGNHQMAIRYEPQVPANYLRPFQNYITQAVLDRVPPTGLQLLSWERVLLTL